MKKREIEITAMRPGRCQCGVRVRPGDRIRWNKDTRRTVGCMRCNGECPDPEFHPDALWAFADDYPIFHSDS